MQGLRRSDMLQCSGVSRRRQDSLKYSAIKSWSMLASLSPSLLPTLICSEIGNHPLDQILSMSLVVGCKVKLSSSCSDHDFLKPGQVGVLIEDDGSDVPFKVEFQGNTHWYTRSQLELADARVEAVAPALLPLTPQVPSCSVDEPLTLSHDSGFNFSNLSTSETDVEFPCGPVNLFSNMVVGMAASTSARFSFIPRGGNSAWAVGIIPESRQSDENVIWESPIGWHRGGSGVRNASMSSEFSRAESHSLVCTVAVDSTRLELTLEIAGTVMGKQALQPSMFPLRIGICGHNGTTVRAVGGGATIPVLPAAKDVSACFIVFPFCIHISVAELRLSQRLPLPSVG
jgi:hypothetical protein